MLILIVLSVLVVVGIGLLIAGNDIFEFMGIMLTVMCGALLFVALGALPVNYYGTKARIEQFQATRATYEVARKSYSQPSITERAAILMDIADQNRWLKNAQYWNDTMFDIWIPDEVMNLKPLE